ncbi:hypothetical protein ASPWEDRAFT_413126 [Aspergillus wentii DTO 134E9]|uniref:Uncharacterized protein n=1 Tax=Aspergillus wentii DTO 134E9 TaxID=1073089 RepID=A0A1L9RNY1_ASPWE|nr:uncharacterized protein ASPWEDRAFT_413126 [Aspergillus wentii DTO 134E9]OJJ36573.1 hypothetical protein ASPWEDRAFT_413126 [Aspergillus wentii DTO 134E9]
MPLAKSPSQAAVPKSQIARRARQMSNNLLPRQKPRLSLLQRPLLALSRHRGRQCMLQMRLPLPAVVLKLPIARPVRLRCRVLLLRHHHHLRILRLQLLPPPLFLRRRRHLLPLLRCRARLLCMLPMKLLSLAAVLKLPTAQRVRQQCSRVFLLRRRRRL